MWVDKTKLKYVKNANSFKATTKKNTVHNLITFSIVFTNKNGGGGGSIQPPSPSKLGVFNTLSKLRLLWN